MTDANGARLHPTAIVEEGATLGAGTRVWDSAHVRRGARIGRDCIIGEKSCIAYDVVIGDCVKLNTGVYVCAGVTVEDFVMLSAHVVFTNDRFPRAGDVDLAGLETSDPTDETCATRVCRGATVGANATIGPGVTLGAFAMVGMGAVVTRDVPAHGLAVGNPARLVGWVCVCGHPLVRLSDDEATVPRPVSCAKCGRGYELEVLGLRLVRDREPAARRATGAP